MPSTFHLETASQEIFHSHGLASFDALMNDPVGEMVSCPEDRRRLFRFSLPKDGGHIGYYLKRMSNEPVVRLLKSLLAGRRPHSGPLREMQLLIALRRAGFATMAPVAWGEARRWGIPVAGFLVVEEIRGYDVAKLFDAGFGRPRIELLKEVGQLIGRLHAAGFFHPVRLKDLILEESSRQLVLIDRETSKPWPTRFSRQRAVAALARTTRRTLRDGHRFGPAAVRGFLDGYAAGVASRWPVAAGGLRRSVLDRLRREFT